MSIKSLAHACVKTPDLAATLDFYCKGLGMTKKFDFIKDGKVFGFYIAAGNTTFIEVFEVEKSVPVESNAQLHHFCLQTDSIKEQRQRLVDLGYAAREIIMGADGSLQFWATDPNGQSIEFQEYTDKSCQFTGKDCVRT